jgi:hypothetical protein
MNPADLFTEAAALPRSINEYTHDEGNRPWQ